MESDSNSESDSEAEFHSDTDLVSGLHPDSNSDSKAETDRQRDSKAEGRIGETETKRESPKDSETEVKKQMVIARGCKRA